MTEFEKLLQCKNFTSAIKIVFNKDYSNGRLKNDLVLYCKNNYNIDIEEIIANNNRVFCKNCGKEIFGEKRSGKLFCSQSCAATFNNKARGKRSNETKEKISKSLISINAKVERGDAIRNADLNRYEFRHICENENCHKEFFSYRKNQRFCSKICAQNSDVIKNSLRNKMLEKVANGTHSGWKCRNIKSYAEIFWENVLKNNSIEFIREDFSTKKYFLDFLILKNGKRIDVEIDGKQHNMEERKKHDNERDAFLKENGYIVYRIPWNSINTKKGKLDMELKIDAFLNFYNNV